MRMKHAKVFNPPSVLPGWARRCQDVVTVCESNSMFRRNVMGATDPRYKQILVQEARIICRKVGGG